MNSCCTQIPLCCPTQYASSAAVTMGYNGAGLTSPFAEKVESLHSRSKGSSPEDEIVTWLQYPLDYTHERGYCSELFERLAPSLGKAELDSDQGVPVSMENPGRRGTSTGSENARDALALGAGRASGSVLSKGAETFNKVKTIMQQAPCLQSNSSQHKASSVEKRYENCEPFPTSLQFRGLSNTTLLADEYPSYGALHNFPTNCMWSSVSPSFPTHSMGRLQLSENAAAGSAPCESSHLINSKGIEKGSYGQAHIKDTQGSSYSLMTEDYRRDASMLAASARHWETVGNAAYNAGTSVRLAPPHKEKEWQETCGSMHADMPDVFVPSCSGGSQTSAELSAKETSSLRKKAVDDHDCQSKNAEVDSAETSQPHRRRPKRSRVAESHNLSEKRRRNRINEKLKTLQELIPNSSKTDKASILDEAIEYLKALQLQLQVMSSRSGMKVSPMSFPLGMQHIQMAHSVGLGFPLVHAGMGMGSMELQHGMDGRAFQALSAASPHFNLAYPRTVSTPSQPYLAMEVPSCELWPFQQPPAQAYHQMYVEPQTATSTEQGEQLSTPRSHH